jgi:transcriptional regulator with XRE-family HTH domain/lambda repressor-like predicted transcriptional regulator
MTKKDNIILTLLKKSGYSPTDIAKSSGLAMSSVYHTIRRISRIRLIQDVIADLVKMDPESLWGADYSPIAKTAIREITFDARAKKYLCGRIDNPGNRMRKIRYELKMPLEVLSENTGIHIGTLSSYENHHRRMSRKTIERISLGLGVDPNWIEFGDEAALLKVVLTEDVSATESHSQPSYPDESKSQEKLVS